MNFRTGSAANSDFWNIYMAFIGSLQGSQSTMLIGYSGGVISYVMPMVGIIYFMTEVFTNLFAQLSNNQLTNVMYNSFLSTIFGASLATLTVYTTTNLFTTFVMQVADAQKNKNVVFAETGLVILGKGFLYGSTVYLIC